MEKTAIGPLSEYTRLSVDTKLNIVAVLQKSSLLIIINMNTGTMKQKQVEMLSQIEFINGTGILIGVGRDLIFHHWHNTHFTEALKDYVDIINKYPSTFAVGNLLRKISSLDDLYPVFLGDEVGRIELVIFNHEKFIFASSCDNMETKSQEIQQIVELSCENHIIRLAALINGQVEISEFSLKFLFHDQISFDKVSVLYRSRQKDVFTHLNLVDRDTIFLSTASGEIATLYRRNSNYESGEKYFPYGPFPCKSINKCLSTEFSCISGLHNVFAGGLPKVTYAKTNSLTISLGFEPDICFTFCDPIVDYVLLKNEELGRIVTQQILVLTKSELVLIYYDKGCWMSKCVDHMTPIMRNKVLSISEVIEISTVEIEGNGEKETVQNDFQVFATANECSHIHVWRLTKNEFIQLYDIELTDFFSVNRDEEKHENVLWPNIQKCGTWTSGNMNVDIHINSLFIKNNSNKSFYLITLINNTFVIVLEVFSDIYRNSVSGRYFASSVSIDKNFIKNSPSNISIKDEVSLKCNDINVIAILYFTASFDIIDVDTDPVHGIFALSGSKEILILNTKQQDYILIKSKMIQEKNNPKKVGLLLSTAGKSTEKTSLPQSPSTNTLRVENRINDQTDKSSSSGKLFNIVSVSLNCSNVNSCEILVGLTSGTFKIFRVKFSNNGSIENVKQLRKSFSKRDSCLLKLSIVHCQWSSRLSENDPNFISYDKDVSYNSEDSSCEISSSYTGKSERKSSDASSVMSSRLKTLNFKWLKSKAKTETLKPYIFKCGRDFVKVLSYTSFKTKYKLKLSEYLKDQTNLSVDPSSDGIIHSIVVKSSTTGAHFMCYLLLSMNSIAELSLPTLTNLRYIVLNDVFLVKDYFTISQNTVFFLRRITVNNEYITSLELLRYRDNGTIICNGLHKLYHLEEQKHFNHSSEQCDGVIEFMKSAQDSFHLYL